ncbi:MAG: hypothetical protein QT00_C0001G0116 [archaeon GW2011_AR5]|nr:MAG: hypothetical protein QT00_C0001G0116 [archaeon GW2011_AR5]
MKGITPVIAVILLLLITISMVGFSMVFFQRTAETATKAGDEQLQQQLANFASQPRIESVSRNRVYVRNAGSSDLGNVAFFVNDAAVTHAGPATLAPGSIETYYLNDAQLALLEDGTADVKITSGGFNDVVRNVCFYCDDAIAWWKFDEGSGTVAADSSGNGNDGTFNNGVVWAAGKYGNAISLDSASEYVEKDITDITVPQMTLEFWMRPTTVGGGVWRDIVGTRGHIDETRFHLHATDNSLMWYGIASCGGSYDTNIIPTANQWYHVVGTLDGSRIKIFIDGQLQLDQACAGQETLRNIVAGSDGEIFIGQIDEVRVLNIARSMGPPNVFFFSCRFFQPELSFSEVL